MITGGNKGRFYCHLIATYYHFWHKISKITVFLRDLLRPDAVKNASRCSICYVPTQQKLRPDVVKDTS